MLISAAYCTVGCHPAERCAGHQVRPAGAAVELVELGLGPRRQPGEFRDAPRKASHHGPRTGNDEREQDPEARHESAHGHEDHRCGFDMTGEEGCDHRNQGEADHIQDPRDDGAPRASGDADREPGPSQGDEGDVRRRPRKEQARTPRRGGGSEQLASAALALREQRGESPGSPHQEAGGAEGGHEHGPDRQVHSVPGRAVTEQSPDENQHQDGDDAGDRRADQEPAASRTGDRHE